MTQNKNGFEILSSVKFGTDDRFTVDTCCDRFGNITYMVLDNAAVDPATNLPEIIRQNSILAEAVDGLLTESQRYKLSVNLFEINNTTILLVPRTHRGGIRTLDRFHISYISTCPFGDAKPYIMGKFEGEHSEEVIKCFDHAGYLPIGIMEA